MTFTSQISRFSSYLNGETPYVKDGNWWVGDTDTGVAAQAVDGVSFSGIEEYYYATLATDVDQEGNPNTPTWNKTKWFSQIQDTKFGKKNSDGATYKYLWNVEIVKSTDASGNTTEAVSTVELFLTHNDSRVPETYISYYKAANTSEKPKEGLPKLGENNNFIVPPTDTDWILDSNFQGSKDESAFLFEISFVKYAEKDEKGHNLYALISGPSMIGHNGANGQKGDDAVSYSLSVIPNSWNKSLYPNISPTFVVTQHVGGNIYEMGKEGYIIKVGSTVWNGGSVTDETTFDLYVNEVLVDSETITVVKDGEDGKTPLKGVDYFDGSNGKDGTSIVWKGEFDKAPANPQNGWAYHNTTAKASYTYQDGAWYQMSIDGIDGQNGTDGLPIVWKGELTSSPSNPQINWVYKDKDDGKVYIFSSAGWELMVLDGSDGIDGAPGTDGLSVFITYNDSISEPSKPIGTGTTNGWHTAATADSIWMSQKVGISVTEGAWGSPIRIKGLRGTSILPINTSPTAHIGSVSGVTVYYKWTLDTIKSNAGVNEVLVGDVLERSYYHYPIVALDDTYAYAARQVSIRGSNGTNGTNGTSPYLVTLDNEVAVIGTNSSGGGYTSATLEAVSTVYATAYEGNTNITKDCVFAWEADGGTLRFDTGSCNWLSSISKDDVLVTVTATYGSEVIGSKHFALSKNKQGNDAVTYILSVTPTTWNKSSSSSVTPSVTVIKYVGSTLVTPTTSEYSIKVNGTAWSGGSISATTTFDLYVGDKLVDSQTVTAVQNGAAGRGISNITNYYLVSTQNTGITTSTSGWDTTVKNTDETNCYLWNYEKIEYTSGTPASKNTDPRIISTHGRTGAAGRSITTISETYMRTSSSSKPAASNTSWQATIPTLDSTYQWLWCKEVISYSSGDPDVFIKLIAQRGQDGNDGQDGQDGSTGTKTEAVRIFAYNTSNSAPTLTDSTPIGSTLTGISSGIWTTAEITASSTYKFVFTSTGVKTTTYSGTTAQTPTYSGWTTPELWGAWLSNSVDVKAYAEFLKLTNNGTAEGLKYNENGNLYINATYINTGTLTVGDSTAPTLSVTAGEYGTASIAGWTVSRTYGIYSSSYRVGMVDPIASSSNFSRTSLISGSSKIVFYTGSFDPTGSSANNYTKIPEFAVLADGSLYASAAQITGAITAKSGYIGPSGDNSFKIEEMTMTSSGTKYLAIHRGLTYNSTGTYYSFTNDKYPMVLCPYGVKSATNLVKNGSASDLWVFLAGKVTSGVVPFGITDKGALYASAGNIGGFSIGAIRLEGGSSTYESFYYDLADSDSDGLYELKSSSFILCPSGIYSSSAPVGLGAAGKYWKILLGTNFAIQDNGSMFATAGIIGKAYDSGILNLNGSQQVAGENTVTTTFFMQKGTPDQLSLSKLTHGLSNNYFHLSQAGLVFRNPTYMFKGLRITSSGMFVDGSTQSVTSPSGAISCYYYGAGQVYSVPCTNPGQTTNLISTGKSILFDKDQKRMDLAETWCTLNNSDADTNSNWSFRYQIHTGSRGSIRLLTGGTGSLDGYSGQGWEVAQKTYFRIGNDSSNYFYGQTLGSTDYATFVGSLRFLNGLYSSINETGPRINISHLYIDFWYNNSNPAYITNGQSAANLSGTWTASKSITVSSDRRLKTNISAFGIQDEKFFDTLKPCQFELKNYPGPLHFGLIADEVEIALEESGLGASSHGLFSADIGKGYRGLAYEEFIALNTWQIQKLKPRMTAAEQEIENLKLEIAQLREEIKNLQNS